MGPVLEILDEAKQSKQKNIYSIVGFNQGIGHSARVNHQTKPQQKGIWVMTVKGTFIKLPITLKYYVWRTLSHNMLKAK
jgi:hypothetical protein